MSPTQAPRVLHLVKTADGATWAALQCRELVRLGADVHVAIPSRDGAALPLWEASGATLHVGQFAIGPSEVGKLGRRFAEFRRLVDTVKPDIVHSHFFQSAIWSLVVPLQ